MSGDRESRKVATDTLFRDLVGDAHFALERIKDDDRPVLRREAMRSIIAAIEGVAWVYRQHIRNLSSDMVELSPLLDLAFDEKTYSVTENGELVEQVRFVPFTSMFRLTTRIASEICDAVSIDFGESEWSKLKKAIDKRNSLAHPKSSSDLNVTNSDLENAKAGLFWVLENVVSVMDQTVTVARRYSEDAKNLVADLIDGNEIALAGC